MLLAIKSFDTMQFHILVWSGSITMKRNRHLVPSTRPRFYSTLAAALGDSWPLRQPEKMT